ncbi:FBD-associated F-box protein At4g10400-like [Bidens hawaiensis]|uniref:FBD-associated F-box protein At4g10400-like n=1 Tax=Bidens hawaiensis TaxID=980011 RepID=UPI00404A66AB
MSSIGENVDDRISRLPEDTLSHILSLMPTKCAVRTSVLSKKWRFSWMLVTNLDFDYTVKHSVNGLDSFSKFVDRVLSNCKTSRLQLFRLRFCDKVVSKSRVSSWIDKAVRLDVRELDMQVVPFELPLSLLTCKTLTNLRLDFSGSKHDGWECASSVNLPCLKTLDIVVYTNPFVNVFKLIHGCPVLESLSLEVKFSDNTGDYVFDIPTLKQLKLILVTCGYAVNSVVLNVPNLEHLSVGGMLGSCFVVNDLPPSVEVLVSFDCVVSYECTMLDLWSQFMRGISGVKSLTIQEVLSSSPLPVFQNLKRLDLKSFWYSGEVVKCCPALEHLSIEKSGKYCWGESCWFEPKLVPACMLTNLTTINFTTRTWQTCDMEFLAYVLANAEVLKTVTVTWESGSVEEERRLCTKLTELPTASRSCEIHFQGASGPRVVKAATGH